MTPAKAVSCPPCGERWKESPGCCFSLCHQPAERSQESQLRYQPLRVIISEMEIFFFTSINFGFETTGPQALKIIIIFLGWRVNSNCYGIDQLCPVLPPIEEEAAPPRSKEDEAFTMPGARGRAYGHATTARWWKKGGSLRGWARTHGAKQHRVRSYFSSCQWWYGFSKTPTQERVSADVGINSLEGLSLYVITVSIWVPLPQYLNGLSCTAFTAPVGSWISSKGACGSVKARASCLRAFIT